MYRTETDKKIPQLTHWVILLTLLGALAACSSPEEKLAKYLASANSLYAQGNLSKATLEYKNALQINQNLPDAWFGLAKIYQQQQDWRQTYASLQKILETNPDHVDGRIMLGQIFLASNQLDQALTDAKDLLQLAADNARVHALMAAVQFRLGNNQAAQESVDRALEIDSTDNEAILVQARLFIVASKFDAAVRLLDQAIRTNPRNVALYLMKIQAHVKAADNDSVKQVFTQLIAEFPENNSFRHDLASTYLRDGNIEKATDILREIVVLRPDSVSEKLRLAEFVQKYHSIEDALALVKNYVAENGGGFELKFKLAELHERYSQVEAAREIYQAIIAEDGEKPNGLKAKNHLALLNLNQGNYETAKIQVDEVLAQDKNNENGLLLRAGFKIDAKQYDDAIVDLRTILRDNPNSTKALGLLGQAYSANGTHELALETYTKAFEIEPENRIIANTLAGNYIRRSKMRLAEGVLQKSIQNGNSSVDAVKLLTQAKLALGDWDEAERLAHQLKQIKGEEALSEQVMGVVFQGRDQQVRSIEAFKRAHELAPEASQPMVSLVQTYLKRKKIPQAQRFLQAVLSDNDKNVTAYVLLGQLSLIERNNNQAIAHFSQLIKVEPKLDIGYRGLSSVYMQMGDFNQAEEVVRQGLEVSPKKPILQIKLASIYERSQAFDEAIAIYEAMLAENPELIVARNNLASLLSDHREDRESHERALELAAAFKDSRIPQFRDTYAWASVKTETNLEQALLILEKIVKNSAQIGVYHYHLGAAYRKTGRSKKALLHLAKAMELDGPESDLGKKAQRQLDLMN